MANETEVKWDGEKTHTITISNNFKTGKFLCSQNATIQPKSTVEFGYMCIRGLSGPPAVTLTK